MNMALGESLRVAWDGLVANRIRSALTMLGVVIGVAAVVALLSIGQGAQSAITSRISAAGTNLVFVSAGMVRTGPVRGAGGSAITLTYEDAEAIADPANVPDAVAVAPEFSNRAQVILGDANANVSLSGVTPAYQDALNVTVDHGRFIDQSDLTRHSLVAVVGYQVAQDLFGGVDPVGQKVKASTFGRGANVSLTVVGVLAEQGGSMLANADETVYVPITTAQTRLFQGRNILGKTVVSRINVVAASEKLTEAVKEDITALLTARHKIAADRDLDFTVMSQAEMLAMATEISGVLTIFLGAIAGVSLVVGGIGIMNIMLVSVAERTREIGLRKAVGARRADILTQFMLESVVLSGLGGLVGVAAGIVVARIVALSGTMRAVTTPLAVALALGAALAVGLFFGIYPASRAAGLSPIEALHHE